MSSAQEMITAAKANIENLTPEEVAAEVEGGEVLLLDVREPPETARGFIPTALFAPRGILEFCTDVTSPHHIPALVPDQRVIVYSASGSRSALAAARLQDLGYRDVAHLDGGYRRWLDEGWAVLSETAEEGKPTSAQVELVLPDDERRLLLRVRLNGERVGDLLFSANAERDAMLDALTEGAVSVARRPVPIADLSIAESAPPPR